MVVSLGDCSQYLKETTTTPAYLTGESVTSGELVKQVNYYRFLQLNASSAFKAKYGNKKFYSTDPRNSIFVQINVCVAYSLFS
jgi:hypothetical protein